MYGHREVRLPDNHCSLMKTTCGERGRAGNVDMYPSAHSMTSQLARRIIALITEKETIESRGCKGIYMAKSDENDLRRIRRVESKHRDRDREFQQLLRYCTV